MNVRVRFGQVLLGFAILGTAACGKRAAKAAPISPDAGAAVNATTEPSASADAVAAPGLVSATDESGSEGPAKVELEWDGPPLQADLDGDGAPESISWTCGGTLALTVGGAQSSEVYQLVEEMGCEGAVVALLPVGATQQLVISIDEHEEVGPDLYMLYAYREGRLEPVWSDKASVEFFADGSWTTETSDCFETRGYRATWYGRHRWDGEEVTSEEQEVRDPVEPGDCIEP